MEYEMMMKIVKYIFQLSSKLLFYSYFYSYSYCCFCVVVVVVNVVVTFCNCNHTQFLTHVIDDERWTHAVV